VIKIKDEKNGWICGICGEKRHACRGLVVKSEEKRTLEGTKRRLHNKIKMVFKKLGGKAWTG
jgi:hypothetical protein